MAGPFHFPRGQAPSLKRTLQADTVRGTPRVRAWPRKRTKAEKEAQKERTEWFRQAQWLGKYITAGQRAQLIEATAGTPFYPRDLITMAMAGRLFVFTDQQGNKVWPMAIRTDVSQALDIIGHAEGALLFRDTNTWNTLNPADAGWFLKSQGPGMAPAWAPVSAGGSLIGNATRTTTLTAGGGDYFVPWEASEIDQATMWDVADPTKFTVPADGFIKCDFTAYASNSKTASNASIRWYINGTLSGGGPGTTQWIVSANLPWRQVSAGDYIRLALRNCNAVQFPAPGMAMSYDYRAA